MYTIMNINAVLRFRNDATQVIDIFQETPTWFHKRIPKVSIEYLSSLFFVNQKIAIKET